MTSTVVKWLSAGAAVLAVFGAGYASGNRNIDRAAETMAAMFAVLTAPAVQAVLSENTKSSLRDARAAVAENDFEAATSAISSRISEIEQEDCKPSGTIFAAQAGALVRNCETGMTAAIASVNANGTTSITVGDQMKSGAFLGRFEAW